MRIPREGKLQPTTRQPQNPRVVTCTAVPRERIQLMGALPVPTPEGRGQQRLGTQCHKITLGDYTHFAGDDRYKNRNRIGFDLKIWTVFWTLMPGNKKTGVSVQANPVLSLKLVRGLGFEPTTLVRSPDEYRAPPAP